MTDSAAIAIPADELTLARLACAKLTGMVQGTFSIGIPALLSGVPDPRVFFEEQFRALNGFAIVLHSVACKPGGQQTISRLRTQSGAIAKAIQDLQTCLNQHLDSKDDLSLSLSSAKDLAV